MQPSGIDAPIFVQFFNEECPKWQQHSSELRERAGSCGREDFTVFSRLIDEYVEVLRAFSKGHPIPAALGAATLKILEMFLCKVFMEVAGGIQTMPSGPSSRSRPGGKLDRPKLGKQMHELLTRGKVAPNTITQLVALRRQCKAAMYDPDAVQMMQQGGSAVKQAADLGTTAMQSLWKHVQYTLYNQRPEELMGGARPPAPYTPSAPGYSPPPPAAPAHYAAPPSAPHAYQATPAPAPYQAAPPGAYAPPPPGAYPPYSAAARPADYQGPPLGPVGAGGAAPQPVQPQANPYAQMPEKPAARPKPTPGRPAPPPATAPPPVMASRPEYHAPPPGAQAGGYPPPQQYYPPPGQAPYDPYAYAQQPPDQQAYAPPPVPQRPGKR